MKQNKCINISRLELIRKGYLNQKELGIFLNVGKKKAKNIYNIIVTNIQTKEKMVDILGIPTQRALEYMGLTENDIRRFAADEKKEMDNYGCKER